MVVAVNKGLCKSTSPSEQNQFLEMLPTIRRQASMAFRDVACEEREELVEETIAAAYCSWVRLIEQGRQDIAYATPLTKYAVRHVRAGRRVGNTLNANDVLSPYARRIRSLRVERLDDRNQRTGELNQQLVEDRRAGPAETAAARLDVGAWFHSLSPRNRRIARALSLGGQTAVVARRFGLTAGRISQLRASFHSHWIRFQDGLPAGAY